MVSARLGQLDDVAVGISIAGGPTPRLALRGVHNLGSRSLSGPMRSFKVGDPGGDLAADVGRFPNPRVVASWAGMTPKHKESDFTLQRSEITKQGPVLVRWAAAEAVTGNHCEAFIKAKKRRIVERRGYRIGKVAAARELLTLVFYGLRDGEIRCLQADHQPAAV